MLPFKPTALAVLACVAVAGCAGTAIDDNVAAARADAQSRAPVDFTWLRSDAARAQARADVDTALKQPLAQADAQRIALSYSPAFQAALFDAAAASAEATQSARLPNPVFAFERLASGGTAGELEITRSLTLPLVDLLLLPARLRNADAAQQQARLRIAGDVLRTANDAGTAWVAAVAARQSADHAQRVQDAADAGTDLARRMEAVGNFSALQRAREEAFSADAAAELAQARRTQRATRETLVRTLGLDTAQAAALVLPEHLPELPANAPAAATDTAAVQAALDTRLDLRLAKVRLAAVARNEGLTRVTSVVDGLEIGPALKSQAGLANEHGIELSVPLPLFDAGDGARAGAQATYEAALQRSAALAVDAASQLRSAQGDAHDAWELAREYRDRIVPLQASITHENQVRYNSMLASAFDLLADAREQSRTVQKAIAAQRDFWLADAALQAATIGLPATAMEPPSAFASSLPASRAPAANNNPQDAR